MIKNVLKTIPLLILCGCSGNITSSNDIEVKVDAPQPIALSKRFNEQKLQKTRILLQIHDELIFETPKEEANKISKVIIEEMSSVANSDQHSFSIPLTVDLNTGENWGTLH